MAAPPPLPAPLVRPQATAFEQRWFGWPAFGLIVGVFAALRFACLFNDLWLDEIWSLGIVDAIGSSVQILTETTHDNNHPLNTLFLYLLYPTQAQWTYRLFSWATGVATIGLAGLIARRQFELLHPEESVGRMNAAGVLTAAIVGGSYFFVHYSSEARGYAPAVCFGLLAFHALLRAPRRTWSKWTGVYWLACVLGLLSHLVMVQVIIAGAVWSVVHALRTWDRWRDRLIHVGAWHLLPWIFSGLYYLGFVRRLVVGGTSKDSLLLVSSELLSKNRQEHCAVGFFAGAQNDTHNQGSCGVRLNGLALVNDLRMTVNAN